MKLYIPANFEDKGFTLIELLVVIAIIGLLASIVLASLNSARSKSRDARRMSDLRQIATALELYASDNNGTYPTGCGWSSWGCWPTFIPSQYIPTVPKDPVNLDLGFCATQPNCHAYEYCNTSSGFILVVNLENPPAQLVGNDPGCNNGGPNWFRVKN